MPGFKALNCSLALCLLLGCGLGDTSHRSVAGVLDLRGFQAGDGLVVLEGDWLVHANRFVSPNEPGYAHPDLILKSPRDLAGLTLGPGKTLGARDRATLSIQLRLPPEEDTGPWALALPRSFTAARWSAVGRDADGNVLAEKVVELGEIARESQNVRASRERNYLLLPSGNTVDLSVQLANKVGGHLGFNALPVLGTFAELESLRLRYLIWNAAIIGVLLIIGLYHMCIFLMRPTESAPFWLGFCCLLSSLWVSVESGALDLVPGAAMGFVASMRLQSLCVPLIALSGLMLLAHLGATALTSQWRSLGMGIAACVMGMVLVGDPVAVDGVIGQLGYFMAVVVVGLWCFWTVLRPSFGAEKERLWLRLGGLGCLVGWAADFTNPMIYTSQVGFFSLGFCVFVVSISFVLAIRNDDARSMMEALSGELELKNKELSDLDRLKDEFLAKTSHELRTPLNGIIGLSESLLDGVGGPLEPRLRRNIEMVEQSGKRLSHLVNDILDFSKLRNRRISLDRMPVNFFSAVEMVVELSRPLIGEKKLNVYNVVGKTLAPVYADPNRLQQILFNLVGNAIKFTEQGYVTIRAEHNVALDVIEVSVEDSGIGIALEYRERIFRAFEQGDGSTQREHGGTGLGLAVSRELVKAHGGDLRVASALGMGTTMSFTLPVSEGEGEWIGRQTRAKIPKAEEEKVVGEDVSRVTVNDGHDAAIEHSQYVLIVDDEAVNREVVVMQVAGEGYPVTAFEGGAQVLEWIAQNGPPAVLLLDVMMPGLSGLDVLVELRKQYSLQELPVLLLTARGTDRDMTEGFAAGANDYLVKPFSRPELVNRLRHHLGFTAMSSMLRSTNQILETELGKRHDLEGTLAQMRIRQEEAEQELGVIQGGLEDLSRRVSRVKAKLLQAEKLASLGQMMSGIALSLGEPIQSISLKLKTLRDKLDDSVEKVVPFLEREEADAEGFQESLTMLQMHIENMETGADMINRITRAMLNYDTASKGDYELTLLAGLIQDCLTICSFRLRGVDVDVALDDSCSVAVHRTHLAQVVSNLLSNAVDALGTEEDAGEDHPRIKVTTSPRDYEGVSGVVIEVEDNGHGVPAELKAKIFSPFFTTRPVGKGTGIGLAVSKRIVDEHNGQIYVEDSALLGGARFCVWLPQSSRDGEQIG